MIRDWARVGCSELRKSVNVSMELSERQKLFK